MQDLLARAHFIIGTIGFAGVVFAAGYMEDTPRKKTVAIVGFAMILFGILSGVTQINDNLTVIADHYRP